MLYHGTPEHAVDDPVESLRHPAAHAMADAVHGVAIPGSGR